MATPYNDAPPRAAVVKLYTAGYVAYYDAFADPPPAGVGGTVDDTATYTLRTPEVDPPPTVDLHVGYVTDEQGRETVVFEDRVQAVYRDNGVTVRDNATRTVYTLYTYYVLLYAVAHTGTSQAPVYQWADDPNFDTNQQPPYDPDAGTAGFAADYTRWTSVPV